jgi:hypothetical protein
MPKKLTPINLSKQKEILDKIYNILEISETKSSFILQDIDIDTTKQNLIYDLETEIKEHFMCSNWACFKKNNNQERKWNNMVRYVLKEFDIATYSTRKARKNADGKNITVTEVLVGKNNVKEKKKKNQDDNNTSQPLEDYIKQLIQENIKDQLNVLTNESQKNI